jgi:hypothetical protein
MPQPMNNDKEKAAGNMLKDVVWLLGGTKEDRALENYRNPEEELPGKQLVDLLYQTFATLDPDNNGISRAEMTAALVQPNLFSADQYAMLKLVAKYFDTIINLADDEPLDETVITKTDAQVLGQFLQNSDFKLSELHQWIAISNGTATEKDIGPPPMSGSH